MSLSSFIDKLLSNISQELSKKLSDLEDGKATSFDHYKYIIGYISGLKTSITLVKDLKRKFFYEDEITDKNVL